MNLPAASGRDIMIDCKFTCAPSNVNKLSTPMGYAMVCVLTNHIFFGL